MSSERTMLAKCLIEAGADLRTPHFTKSFRYGINALVPRSPLVSCWNYVLVSLTKQSNTLAHRLECAMALASVLPQLDEPVGTSFIWTVSSNSEDDVVDFVLPKQAAIEAGARIYLMLNMSLACFRRFVLSCMVAADRQELQIQYVSNHERVAI